MIKPLILSETLNDEQWLMLGSEDCFCLFNIGRNEFYSKITFPGSLYHSELRMTPEEIFSYPVKPISDEEVTYLLLKYHG